MLRWLLEEPVGQTIEIEILPKAIKQYSHQTRREKTEEERVGTRYIVLLCYFSDKALEG